MVLVFVFILVRFVYDIVPYQEGTTLQPCRTAAAVGNTFYVRVACLCYAAASWLCRKPPYFVTGPYHTFLQSVMPLWVRVLIDAKTKGSF